MSKIKNKNQTIQNTVMREIESGNIKMKPKWLFVFGSAVTIVGLAASMFTSAFLINLIIFLIRKQGSGIGKIGIMLSSFPIWVPLVALLGMSAGIFLLRKYDFSYKKNFIFVIIIFIVSVIAAGFVMNTLGLNDKLSGRGIMRGLYTKVGGRQEIQNNNNVVPGSSQKINRQNRLMYGYNERQ